MPARRAALAFIFVTVVLDMLALGIYRSGSFQSWCCNSRAAISAHAATVFGVFGTGLRGHAVPVRHSRARSPTASDAAP